MVLARIRTILTATRETCRLLCLGAAVLAVSLVAPFAVPDAAANDRVIFSDLSVLKRPVVIIDPGHGGKDDGAVGLGGIKEKDVTVSIAKRFAAVLKERLRVDVLLTRDGDESLSLDERTRIANEAGGAIFISLHANSGDGKSRGIETYYLDNSGDRQTMRLAELENKVFKKSAVDDASFIVSDVLQSAKIERSITLAHHINDGIVSRLSAIYPDIRNRGVKKGPFFVLMGVRMPCVLVEVAFINDKVEGRRLASAAYQGQIADALIEGVRRYFQGVDEP